MGEESLHWGGMSRSDLALLLVRVALGGTFIAHGAQKLFAAGFAGITGGFASMGVPLPGLTGPLVSLVEFGGGLALVLGLLTRLAALGIGCVMLGAIAFVSGPAGYFLPKGVEYNLILLAVALALLIAGPGSFSIDALLAPPRFRRKG